ACTSGRELELRRSAAGHACARTSCSSRRNKSDGEQREHPPRRCEATIFHDLDQAAIRGFGVVGPRRGIKTPHPTAVARPPQAPSPHVPSSDRSRVHFFTGEHTTHL